MFAFIKRIFNGGSQEPVTGVIEPEYKIKMNGYGEFFVYYRWHYTKGFGSMYNVAPGTYRTFEDAHNNILERLDKAQKSERVTVAEFFTEK
jgi:hypothetical protein